MTEEKRKTPPVEAYARQLRWENRTTWPMFVISLAFLAATITLLGVDGLAPVWRALLALVIVVCWIAFIVDVAVRFSLSPDKRTFLRRRWFEPLSLIVPYIRPFLVVAYLWRLPVFQRSRTALRARYILSIAVFALLFVYAASSAVWLVERHDPRANIVSLGDAVWWGFSTIATVGYGDYVPVTVAGRTIAVLLMIGGVAVIGVTSATIVSALTDQIKRAGVAAEREREAREAAGLIPPAPRLPLPHHRTTAPEPPLHDDQR